MRQRLNVWRHRHPYLTRVFACCFLLFLLFEVGIRLVPPNGVTMREVDSVAGKPIATFQSADPAKVRYWHGALSGRPKYWLPMSVWNYTRIGLRCPDDALIIPEPVPNTTTYTFTFDGIPVESFTGEMDTPCGSFTESAGGIPNFLWQYANEAPVWEPLPVSP